MGYSQGIPAVSVWNSPAHHLTAPPPPCSGFPLDHWIILPGWIVAVISHSLSSTDSILVWMETSLFVFNLLFLPFHQSFKDYSNPPFIERLSAFLLPLSLPSGIACSFLSISTLGKTRKGKFERKWGLDLGACRLTSIEAKWEKKTEKNLRKGKESEAITRGDLTIICVSVLINDNLMTWD